MVVVDGDDATTGGCSSAAGFSKLNVKAHLTFHSLSLSLLHLF
jgi:hypothetical protein